MRPESRYPSLYFDYSGYPFVRPLEFDKEGRRHKVAIVGADPVGVTAALALARQGVSCVVIDNKDTVNDGGRAICNARHSFEILQQPGLTGMNALHCVGKVKSLVLNKEMGIIHYRLTPRTANIICIRIMFWLLTAPGVQ